MKILPTRWDLINLLKGKKVLDIGGIGYGGGYCEKLFSDAWTGIRRTTMDISKEADIIVDLNKLPLPKVNWKAYDVATCFDCLEHLKYPAEVLEWIEAKELFINLPCSSSLYMQNVERGFYAAECAGTIPNSFHIFGFKPITAKPLLEQCGWKVNEMGYMFDYQSWMGKMLGRIATCAPYFLSQGFFVKCSK